ncbi:MAG: DNRLRE domain-containing protein, partial [Candidatus Bathyarchaeia archaeon]
AHLRLYYMEWVIGNPSGRTYGAYRLTEGWTETESTWNKRDGVTPWTTAGGVWTAEDFASSIVPPSAEQWMSWDVTGIVKDWIEDGQPNYGFIVRDQNDGVASTDASARFYMREYVTEPALRPVLEIEYVLPTPVGGIVMPTNKLEILAPYVALAGLVAIISMLAAIRRRPKA